MHRDENVHEHSINIFLIAWGQFIGNNNNKIKYFNNNDDDHNNNNIIMIKQK